MEYQPTMTGVLWRKAIASVERTSLPKLARTTGLTVAALGVSYASIRTDSFTDMVQQAFDWQNNALVKLPLSFALTFNAGRLYRLTRAYVAPAFERPEHLVEGVPSRRLLDHLFSARSFKRADVMALGMAHQRYQVLAAKLEKLHVLQRGDNNAFVLNPEFSRSDVETILQSGTRAEELEFWRKEGTRLTTEPSFTTRIVSC